jgi:DNA-directed RNA polymerase subunit RPC12/RpoP
MSLAISYRCSDCDRQLEKGDFMAVVGKAPATGLSGPLGRADAILSKVGKIYCQQCFAKRYERKSAD